MTNTIDDLLPGYPNLAKFAQFLYQKVQNPTVPPQERKDAELVLKDIRLLATKALGLERKVKTQA